MSRTPSLALALLASVLACQSERSAAEARKRIESALADYALALGQSYLTGQTEELARVAAPREVERVRNRITELAEEGKFLEARLLSRNLESFEFPRATSCFVEARERWSFEVKALGSRAVLAVEDEQVQLVRYTLVRQPDGSWIVLSRAVVDPAGRD